jgi:hypothetical protein
MAALTAEELRAMRNESEPERTPHSHTKAQVNAAFQALEDYYQNTAKAGFGSAIETAAPGVFTNNQKKKLGKVYFAFRFRID